MNWIRMVLDGIMMGVCFNLFAVAVAIYNPRLMFPCYPPSVIKDAPKHLLQWPLILCPVMASLQAGLGVLSIRL